MVAELKKRIAGMESKVEELDVLTRCLVCMCTHDQRSTGGDKRFSFCGQPTHPSAGHPRQRAEDHDLVSPSHAAVCGRVE